MRLFVFYCHQNHFDWHYLLVRNVNNENEAWEAVAKKEPKYSVEILKQICKIVANLEIPGELAVA